MVELSFENVTGKDLDDMAFHPHFEVDYFLGGAWDYAMARGVYKSVWSVRFTIGEMEHVWHSHSLIAIFTSIQTGDVLKALPCVPPLHPESRTPFLFMPYTYEAMDKDFLRRGKGKGK